MKKIKRFLEFMKEEKGIGVVEVILILVVKWSKDFLCVSCA